MIKLCNFLKKIIGIDSNLMTSFLMMSSFFFFFMVVFSSRIETIKDILLPIVSIPLSIYTILYKKEPILIMYFFAFIIWLIVVLLSFFDNTKIICTIQNTYAIISLFLASIIIIGKTF
jgi:hypothetical protein